MGKKKKGRDGELIFFYCAGLTRSINAQSDYKKQSKLRRADSVEAILCLNWLSSGIRKVSLQTLLAFAVDCLMCSFHVRC